MRTGTMTAAWLLTLAMGFQMAACKKKKPAPNASQSTPAPMAVGDTMEPPARPVERAAGDPGVMRAAPDQDPAGAMDTAPDPTVPAKGQATARMILIPWKDAENLAEELTRSKAEARTLAETVLKEARAKPTEAAFAKLVKKYSIGSLKENGGKVGPFGPKDVPAFFAKAVFSLKPGQISGIVESKSGFHIFMRTK